MNRRIATILKREIYRLTRLIIAAIWLTIMLVASVIVFPVYIASLIGKN